MLIPQEDFSGCAVACVASLSGMSYQKTLRCFDKPRNARFIGYYCRDIVKVLVRLGYTKSEWRYVTPKVRKRIQDRGTIIFIARSDRYPIGHFLLRLDEGWMDPWMDFPKVGIVRAGIRKRLPGRPIYAVFPMNPSQNSFRV